MKERMVFQPKENTFMIRRFRPLIAIAFAVLAASLAQAGNPTDFTLQAVGQNKTFKLSDARGHYIALHFLLKTECPFCLKEIPLKASRCPFCTSPLA